MAEGLAAGRRIDGADKPEGPGSSAMWRWLNSLFTYENLAAVALCLIVIAVIIVTADSSPQWIYQGF